jgi:predicted YcjX-like family ATPase
LPDDPEAVFRGEGLGRSEAENDWRFVRFRPPIAPRGAPAPHIRLDRALQFLIGDKLA